MSELSLNLFGAPAISYLDRQVYVDRRKAIALLAYLALSEQRQSRDVVATLLWPEQDQKHARGALRSTLSTLTTLLPGTWLHRDRDALALKHQAMHVDVRHFLALLSRGRAHHPEEAALCEACVAMLEEASALYRGDFMAGFTVAGSPEFENWQLLQREWLRREQSHILGRLVTHYSLVGALDVAIARATHWLALDPLHEPAHRMLMRLYTTSGQRAEALRQYQRCEAILDAELATPPEAETIRLYNAIQSEKPLSPRADPAEPARDSSVLPPLPSLVVGRERAFQEIKARLGIGGERRAVTVIQGWPGVGKSTTLAALAHDAELARRFPDGILWVSLGETPNMLAQLNVWARALSLGEPGIKRSLEMATLQLRGALRERRMLLLVDDAWQVEHAAAFNVGGQQCALIISTRLNDVAHALAPTAHDLMRLPELEEAAGLALLAALAPETVTHYPAEARNLVRDLEGLPLAIQVAGRLLHDEARLGWGIGDLLAELREGARILDAHAPVDMMGRNETPSPTIAALLQRSTDALDEETRQLFALLGLFAPKPATFDLGAMSVAWEVDDPRPAARVLVNRGLLEPISRGRFQMHALLVMHARALLDAASEAGQ